MQIRPIPPSARCERESRERFLPFDQAAPRGHAQDAWTTGTKQKRGAGEFGDVRGVDCGQCAQDTHNRAGSIAPCVRRNMRGLDLIRYIQLVNHHAARLMSLSTIRSVLLQQVAR
jgi:hypothetical protein